MIGDPVSHFDVKDGFELTSKTTATRPPASAISDDVKWE